MKHRLVLAASALALATPALGFDCKLAKTAPEKAICADPAARAADAAMSASFAALRDKLPAPAKAGLAASQSAWIKSRDNACADARPLGKCLAGASAARARFLEVRPDAGPGAPAAMVPVFVHVEGRKGVTGVSVDSLKFADDSLPGAKVFNVAVAKLSGSVEQPEAGDERGDSHTFELLVTLAYASPRLVSAHGAGYVYSGGAHGGMVLSDVNVDMATGRLLVFADLLDKAGAAKVIAFCTKAVETEKRIRLDNAPLSAEDKEQAAKGVAEATPDLGNWSFSTDKATVTYGQYVAGSYAEGAYNCDVPYAMLRPLAKKDFPLP